MQNVVIKKIDMKKDLAAGVYLFEAFCLVWSSNLVGSESVQIQSVQLVQNMVSDRT
jgi:hypothetical protein